MKALFLKSAALFAVLFTLTAYSQASASKGIIIATETYDEDLHRLLAFQKTDYYKVKLKGQDLKGKDYRVVTKEMLDGKITKIDTLVDTVTSKFLKKNEPDSLKLYAIGSKTERNKLRVELGLGILHLVREYDCASEADYSLRYLANTEPIQINTPFYLFAYIVPYEREGIQFYCLPPANGADVESWGNTFGIKHLILFELTFYDNTLKPKTKS